MNSVTGYAFALLAFDTKKYEIPVESKWNRVALVEALLNNQHTDGGWTYNSSGSKDSASSVDVTGMVLSALAPYQERSDVKPAIQKLLRIYITNSCKMVVFQLMDKKIQIVLRKQLLDYRLLKV